MTTTEWERESGEIKTQITQLQLNLSPTVYLFTILAFSFLSRDMSHDIFFECKSSVE